MGSVHKVFDRRDANLYGCDLKASVREGHEASEYNLAADVYPVRLCPQGVKLSLEGKLVILMVVHIAHGLPEHIPRCA